MLIMEENEKPIEKQRKNVIFLFAKNWEFNLFSPDAVKKITSFTQSFNWHSLVTYVTALFFSTQGRNLLLSECLARANSLFRQQKIFHHFSVWTSKYFSQASVQSVYLKIC